MKVKIALLIVCCVLTIPAFANSIASKPTLELKYSQMNISESYSYYGTNYSYPMYTVNVEWPVNETSHVTVGLMKSDVSVGGVSQSATRYDLGYKLELP